MRMFIAVEMSDEARQFLGRCQERLRRSGADVRWVRPELCHLTLVFLGEVPAQRLGDLQSAVRRAAAGAVPMRIRPAGAGRFPERGLPRVVWTGVEEPSGNLLRLQKALAEATAAFAQHADDRPYRAHLTLGRVRSAKNARSLCDAVDALADEAGPEFTVEEIVIFRSDLSPQGPTYAPLARVALGAAG